VLDQFCDARSILGNRGLVTPRPKMQKSLLLFGHKEA
jgi:hypothetical protein